MVYRFGQVLGFLLGVALFGWLIWKGTRKDYK
jgi:hypothetical protein